MAQRDETSVQSIILYSEGLLCDLDGVGDAFHSERPSLLQGAGRGVVALVAVVVVVVCQEAVGRNAAVLLAGVGWCWLRFLAGSALFLYF